MHPTIRLVTGPPAYEWSKLAFRGTGHGRVNWPTGTRESKLAYTDTGGYIGIQGLRRWTRDYHKEGCIINNHQTAVSHCSVN